MNRNAYGTGVEFGNVMSKPNGKTVWIKFSPGIDSRKVRDIILRDVFDYSPAAITDYNEEFPERNIISDEFNWNVWATAEQIRSWVDKRTGLIGVYIPDVWENQARNYRYQKIFTAISIASGAIANTETAERVSGYLEKILNSSEQKRIEAFNNLLLEVSVSPFQSCQIADALKYVAAQGNLENPFIRIALAKALQSSGNAPDSQVLGMLAPNK